MIDGKMLVLPIPRWKTSIQMYWRSSDGKKTSLVLRKVRLPAWVWWGRNRGKWREVWVERA